LARIDGGVRVSRAAPRGIALVPVLLTADPRLRRMVNGKRRRQGVRALGSLSPRGSFVLETSRNMVARIVDEQFVAAN